MSVKSVQPKLYSGYFDTLTTESGKESFHNRYRRFKKRCNCQSLQQLVNLSKVHLSEVNDLDNLEKMLNGLRTVRSEYPQCSRIKSLMHRFNSQYRQRVDHTLKSLDGVIREYEIKLEMAKANELIKRVDPLVGVVQNRFSEVSNSNKLMWNEVQQLLADPNFKNQAKDIVEKMANTPELPVDETIRSWGAAMKGLIEQYEKGQLTTTDIKIALLLAGREHTPKLIRYMEALKEREPALAFQLLAENALSMEQVEFSQLAKAVELVLGEDFSNELDLHVYRFEETRRGHFKEGKKKIPSEVKRLMDEIDSFENAQQLLFQMHEDRFLHGSEQALENFRVGVYAMVEDLYAAKAPLKNTSEIEMVLDPSVVEPMISAIVLELAGKAEKGVSTDMFSAFALVLEQCLKETDVSGLTPETNLVVSSLLGAMKTYTGVDLSDAFVQKSAAEQQRVNDISLHVRQGHAEMLEDCEHKSKLSIEGGLDTTVRELLQERRREPDKILQRDDFPKFIEELVDAVKAKEGRENRQVHNQVFSVISLYQQKMGIVEGMKLVLESLNDLMFAFSEQNSDQFARFIMRLGGTLDPDSNISKAICHAVDYAAGIDPLKLAGSAPLSPVSKEQVELTRKIQVFRDYNKALAELEPTMHINGIEEKDLEDARKVQRLIDHNSFQRKVNEMEEEYVDRSQVLGTFGARRLLRRRLYELRVEFSKVFDPKLSKSMGSDDYAPFLQAVIAANPALGAKVLRLLSKEDIEIIGQPEDNEDSIVYMWLQQESLLEFLEPQMSEFLQNMKLSNKSAGEINE